ncbi:response regulator [Pedobacter punctiformis]|uniref:Response regulator transcription factor n=1 Tax=Pedobacter punctiformis TaxID=3004097 RepID=A0ABT4L3Y7_9SPHI|nr:response regulator transcription factor [Pedobacter sp. HCMS5-2]MCZ4242417.1 response regulator transcription factor [Pedobacter sp. HCMS5-2]
MSIKIAFIEDNQVFYHAIKILILENEQFDLVGMFSNAESFLKDFEFIKPEIVLMDIDLPGMSGIEAIASVKANYPDTKIIVLTVHDGEENIINSLKAGADGYLLKKSSLENLSESINVILNGGAPITPAIAHKIVLHFQKEQSHAGDMNNLTSREKEVLSYISEGLLNKEIAEKMFISIDAIKKHAQSIYAKIQVRNRAEAMKKYLNNLG